jgi:hypothetical protein
MDTTQDTNNWALKLRSLHNQKRYLDDVLSKTAVTLHALRERQTRNERLLSTNPTPRSKRKKILQNRWRTGKTIQTCEKEEKVILDCLQVCTNNLKMLEAIINPIDLSSNGANCTWGGPYTESETTALDWNDWTDNGVISPFRKDRIRSLPMDEIPPEMLPDKFKLTYTLPTTTTHTFQTSSQYHSDTTMLLPLVSLNTTPLHRRLSRRATVFEPSITHSRPLDDELPVQLDKLSISGLMGSKSMQHVQARRLSDVTLEHLLDRLSSSVRPAVKRIRSHQSWAALSPQLQQEEREVASSATLKKTNSA